MADNVAHLSAKALAPIAVLAIRMASLRLIRQRERPRTFEVSSPSPYSKRCGNVVPQVLASDFPVVTMGSSIVDCAIRIEA